MFQRLGSEADNYSLPGWIRKNSLFYEDEEDQDTDPFSDSDYNRALKQGIVEVAYARVMLIGPGGVGKSSLLRALMKKLYQEILSTQLADTYKVRNFWTLSKGGSCWEEVSQEEELKELYVLLEKIKEQLQILSLSQERSLFHGSDEFTHPEVKKVIDDLVFSENLKKSLVMDSEVYLRVWDCGGQPVFLNILPAFLTSRTLFLPMFDARQDLQRQCEHIYNSKEKSSNEFEEITTLDLIMKWMATIHATLLKESHKDCHFPRILPVGTHGDDPKVKAKKDNIFTPLLEACADKAFAPLLLNGVIVDNTSAGLGDKEDPSFQIIRDSTDKFASTDTATETPITWVLFRKVFERHAKNKPIVRLEEAQELATACSIPDEALLSVLAFYHDLGVFFHYSTISSLQSVIVADPGWLIKQMAKILALEGFEVVKNDVFWRLLRDRGILVQQLYEQVFSTQSELTPQQIIDLLENFLIVALIKTKDMHSFPGKEYFVPSMLPPSSAISVETASDAVKKAAPLHLIFSTKYLAPGFFTRLAAVLSRHSKLQVDFSGKIFRNQVKFLFHLSRDQVDSVSITEKKFSICVQILRVSPRSYGCPSFFSSCHQIFQILTESFREVKTWLPGISVSFALECSTCLKKDHFIQLQSPRVCQRGVPVTMTAEYDFWVTIYRENETHSDVLDAEICAISRAVEKADKVSELAEALEIVEYDRNSLILLKRWLKEMTSMGTPARFHLLHHLANIGMPELRASLLHGDFSDEDGIQHVQSPTEELKQLKHSYELVMRENEHLKQEVHRLKSYQSQNTNGSDKRRRKKKRKGQQQVRVQHSGSGPPTRLLDDDTGEKAQQHCRAHQVYGSWKGSPAVDMIVSPTKRSTKLSEKDDFTAIYTKLSPYSSRWMSIGRNLGFTHEELSNIEAKLTLLAGAPASYLSHMLSDWLKWAPGDARGSKDYATMKALSEAVDRAGLGLTAQEL